MSLKNYCKNCPDRETCTELCEKAEKYVDQDHVVQREKTIGLPAYNSFPDLVSNIYLTPREKEIAGFLGEGVSRKTICSICNFSEATLRSHIRNLRKALKMIDGVKEKNIFVDLPEELTPKEKKICTLLGRGLSRADICQVLDISRGSLRVHLINARKKLRIP